MATLGELINKRNELPIGDIYEKHISGKTYYYHQYFKNGKRYSEIVKSNDLADLLSKINEGKRLDALINEYKLKDKSIVISNSALNLTGNLMRGNTTVASFNNGVLIFYDTQLAPLIIKRTKSIEAFLKLRVIDMSRTNARLLKKVLNINPDEEYKTPLYSYALSISDNYWFKPKHSKLKYEDVCFDNDLFFNLSLKGIMAIYPNKICLTPELTTGGGYEKGWKNINGEWWMYKVGTTNEIFSELFYAHLFELLHLPTAHYEYDDGYIRSKNFATVYNFEPMVSIAGEDDSYDNVFNALNKIDYQLAKDYIRLCFFDVVLNNIDRHNENCGVLRDKKSGDIVSLAPNYDDNLCLISRNSQLVIDSKEGFLKNFANTINRNSAIKKALKECSIPILNKDIVLKCLNDLPVQIDKNNIVDYVVFRYEYLISVINK